MIYKKLTLYFCANKQVMYKKGDFVVLASNIADGVFTSAFTNCTNLTSVSFPNLTSVGDSTFYSAFTNCTNLTSVSFPKLTSVFSSSFSKIGHSNLTIHVPSSLSSAGLSTDGSEYGTIVYDL